VAYEGVYINAKLGECMIIELTTPRDMRDATEKLFHCQQSTTETLLKITEALNQLSLWMQIHEGIKLNVEHRLSEIERKTDLIMKATRFSQSSAS